MSKLKSIINNYILMKKYSVLHIGFDDTDSPKGMCTTFLAYKIVNSLKKQNVEFTDYPHLIRFNPNVPWKTRGNGAVKLSIKTDNVKAVKEKIKKLVIRFSETKNGANPGLAFFENEQIPDYIKHHSQDALWKLISRRKIKQFQNDSSLETFSLGNGQGLIGAIAAIGYQFSDYTFELLNYRHKSKFGKKRILNKKNVKQTQKKFQEIFNSFDETKDQVLIAPHGPDPVFCGIRGESVTSVIDASKNLAIDEKLSGYMIFKSNQGTSDHLKNQINPNDFLPFTSGTMTGIVSKLPKTITGGHVILSLNVFGVEIKCGVYKPTGITSIAKNLLKGDYITVGGGVRKSTKNFSRILNVELLKINRLAKSFEYRNPFCKKCKKHMKSKGRTQGFECVLCGKKSSSKNKIELNRKLKCLTYIPISSAHRHLTRPKKRQNIKNNRIFDKSHAWMKNY